MKEVIVKIIGTSHFIRSSNFGQIELITLVKQVEDCHHLFVFEGVHLWREFEFLIAIGSTLSALVELLQTAELPWFLSPLVGKIGLHHALWC